MLKNGTLMMHSLHTIENNITLNNRCVEDGATYCAFNNEATRLTHRIRRAGYDVRGR